MKIKKSTLLSLCLFAFLCGLVLPQHVQGNAVLNLLLLLLGGCFILLPRNRKVIACVLLLGFLAGFLRGNQFRERISDYQQYYGKTVSVVGKIQTDPAYDETGQLDFRIGDVVVNGNRLPGQVRVKGRINDAKRGDRVIVEGSLRSGFGPYQASLSFASISVTQKSTSLIERARRQFIAAIYSVLPEPQASLGLGFLIGLRSSLPKNFDDQLRAVGLTHIVVASGYNLTVLVRIARRAFSRRSKYQTFAVSVSLVIGFVLVTGFSASMSRAAIVTLLALGAWYYGRKIKPWLLLLLGASITAGYNPIYIWNDLGWWLSFLAFAGVLIAAPLIAKRIFGNKKIPLLGQVAIETTAAQVLTLPVILFVFGDFSALSLLANIVVVPFIPLAMLTTFIAGVSYMFFGPAVSFLALPAQFILTYIVAIVEALSRPSWVKQSLQINTFTLGCLYLGIIIIGYLLAKKVKINFEQTASIVE